MVTSFVDLSCHLNAKYYTRRELDSQCATQLVRRLARSVACTWSCFGFLRVALQWSCSLLGVRGTIQLQVFKSDWQKVWEADVALRVQVASVCPSPNSHELHARFIRVRFRGKENTRRAILIENTIHVGKNFLYYRDLRNHILLLRAPSTKQTQQKNSKI
jgi:hypothetical protein